jgi:hypothetical protein
MSLSKLSSRISSLNFFCNHLTGLDSVIILVVINCSYLDGAYHMLSNQNLLSVKFSQMQSAYSI